MEQDAVKAVLGPVWTHWGFKYWKLRLHDYAIVAYPYSLWESFMVALRLYLGRHSPDPGMSRDYRQAGGLYAVAPGERFKTRRYEISLIRKIEVVSSYGRNRVIIEKRSGERHTYVIPMRPDTEIYRRKLRELYPGIYAERDFPTTWLGRLLKR